MKIAISGPAGSGKTTFAEFFVKKYGFTRTGFANAVKKVGMDEYGLTYEEAFGHNKNRTVLQEIGHGHRVKYGERYWVDKLLEQINGMDNVIIDDVRYLNEYQTLKDNGFIMVRINASEPIRRSRIPKTFPENPNHPSEIELNDVEDWHVIILNEGSLSKLEGFANKVYNSFINTNDNV